MPVLTVRHPCATAGCTVLVPKGQARCDAHARAKVEAYRAVRAPIDSWYRTPAWRAASREFRNAHPRCACGDRTALVDHRIPWRTGKSEAERHAYFWDDGNWVPMCWRCHSSKSAARDGGFGNARHP